MLSTSSKNRLITIVVFDSEPDASACSAPSSSGQGSAMRTDRLRLNLNVMVVMLLMLTIILMLMLVMAIMVDCGLWIPPKMRTGQVGLNLDDFKTGWLGLVFLDEDVFCQLVSHLRDDQ